MMNIYNRIKKSNVNQILLLLIYLSRNKHLFLLHNQTSCTYPSPFLQRCCDQICINTHISTTTIKTNGYKMSLNFK